MNSAEKPHRNANFSVSSVLRRSPVFRISKLFLSKFIVASRLYRGFGVLFGQNVHDTMITSRVARAGECERNKGKVIQKSHTLDECLERELGIEIPKDRKLKWGGTLQEEHLQYATDDVAHLKELYGALQEILREHGVVERYEAISSRLPDFLGAAM
jgi:ribonuclease D